MADQDIVDWSDLSLSALFFAYRKAKVDCYYESSIRVAEPFIAYEQSLPDKLAALLVRLHAGDAAAILAEGINQPIIFPKRLTFAQQVPDKTDGGGSTAHAFFSDAKRAFRRAAEQRTPTPELAPVLTGRN